MKPRILCLDDETSITSALKRSLAKEFDVVTANTNAEARAIIDKTPDLAIVLSDLRLPDGSGLELLAYAQKVLPEGVRALLTAHIDFDDLVDVLNRQLVHRLILKPWDDSYLRLQMLEALNSHGLIAENRKLERLAITDPVTLLRNHRFFQDQLKIEVSRALRHEREISLIMIDIDHFKVLNDTYGHPAGDDVLRQTAKRLTEAVRNLDTVARYGGEEFAILLPDTSTERAHLVSERIRHSFADVPFEVAGDSTLVTLSLGVASCPMHAKTAPSLVEAADRALYSAKSQGRNQSVVGTSSRP